MIPPEAGSSRVQVDGKFFRLGARKFHVKGITYGPFAPNSETGTFPSPEQTAHDFAQIVQLGANLLRTYYVPPVWFLDLALQNGLKVLIDVPWPKHLCFLDKPELRQAARNAIRQAVGTTRGHAAVFAYSVVNEISPEIVRWSGARKIENFIEELVREAKEIDPACLCTFTSFPSTEYLHVANADFICFNVYLHHQPSLEAYLARLQTLADSKPLILGEFGMDSFREGEEEKCRFLSWQIETAFRAGLAGAIIFSYTDDWYRGGYQIEDWAFGLTTRERIPKPSYTAVQSKFQAVPYSALPRPLRISVVVATYNGERTLKACLQSLSRQNYEPYEIIVIDDGSTDGTPSIAKEFPKVRYLRQTNQGLSAARNAGIAAGTGEVIAFTDDDCRPDEDWLYYLALTLSEGKYAAVGGHNFLPPEDSHVAAAVAVSPGGPAHVMLTDSEAEHIPGCNMAFFKSALDEIGGFDPIFRKAGDDVDVCWRIQYRGYKIGFSPAGFVWHYRRSTVKAYLKQQIGYGEAEALLAQRHPEQFNSFGGGIWHGRIYSPSRYGLILRPAVIYHGVFGSAPFQRLYTATPSLPLMLSTSLAYYSFVLLPLVILALYSDFALPLALAAIVIPVVVCCTAAAQAELEPTKRRIWSRPLIALLFFLQPIVRGWARFKLRLTNRPRSVRPPLVNSRTQLDFVPDQVCYWAEAYADRHDFLRSALIALEQTGYGAKTDPGWSAYDMEIAASAWSRLLLSTATEELEKGQRNIRCRLRTLWSLRGRVFFWTVAAIEAVAILLYSDIVPLLWLLPILLVPLHWFLEDERQLLAEGAVDALDEAARKHSLVRV